MDQKFLQSNKSQDINATNLSIGFELNAVDTQDELGSNNNDAIGCDL